jgi:hypothetical protein
VGVGASFDFRFNGVNAGASTGLTTDLSSDINFQKNTSGHFK